MVPVISLQKSPALISSGIFSMNSFIISMQKRPLLISLFMRIGVLLVLPSITAINLLFVIMPSSHSLAFLFPITVFSIISILLRILPERV